MPSPTCIRIALVSALLVAACGSAAPGQVSQPTSGSLGVGISQPGSAPGAGGATVGPVATPTVEPRVDLGRLRFSTSGWKTDFSKHSVPLEEITSGGPPRDGIPPIDPPKFESVQEAATWLKLREPVIHLEVGGVARVPASDTDMA